MRNRGVAAVAVWMAVGGFTACGPALRQVPAAPAASFEASTACTSGPLELATTFHGARWGEYLRLRVASPRPVVGWVRVLVDGQVYLPPQRWRTGTNQPAEKGTTMYVADQVSANQRCVQRHEPPAVAPAWAAVAPEAVGAGPAPAPVDGAVLVARAPGAVVVVSAAVPVDVAAAHAPAAPAGADATMAATAPVAGDARVAAPSAAFEPAPWPSAGVAVESSVALAPEVAVLVPAAERRAGEHFGFIVEVSARTEDRAQPPPWKPGTRVVVQLYSETPNDYDGVVFSFEQGAWKPGDEAAWDAELDRREADRRRQAHYRAWEARRERDARERRAAAERAWCAAHPDDADCRPRPVAVARWTPRPPSAVPAAAAPRPPEPPKPRDPDGPPPPAPVETPPPRPASYVDWVGGSWTWSGFEWVWLDGWWKVNEAKRREVERLATRPCPAPRLEPAAAPPVPGATWRAGAWVWGAAKWVWLPGAWQKPPEVHRAVPANGR
ncbi:MAG: hypothetical protein AB1730_26010 [Myxococcota bacterium]